MGDFSGKSVMALGGPVAAMITGTTQTIDGGIGI
jgi:hypothetical protein